MSTKQYVSRNTLFIFLTTLLVSIASLANAQDFYRLKGDFSIKLKATTGEGQLTMGKFYYDKNVKTIVYDVTFPDKETWVFKDSVMLKIDKAGQVDRQPMAAINEFSIFHLVLNNQLSNYGLQNSIYKIKGVEKEGDLVITTWTPPRGYAKTFGKVLVSNKDRRLHGVAFFNPADEVLRKQFFKEYKNFNGVEFPCDITDIFYGATGESYQKTTYSNIIVNGTGENHMYNFPVPGL